MKTLMRNGRDRRLENPLRATRGKSACFWLGPISGSHQGPQPQRLHSKAGYMAAPERFAKSQILFPCTAGAGESAVRGEAVIRRRQPPCPLTEVLRTNYAHGEFVYSWSGFRPPGDEN